MDLINILDILISFVIFIISFLLSFKIGKKYYKLANGFLFLSLALLFSAIIDFFEIFSPISLMPFRGFQLILFSVFLSYIVSYIRNKNFLQLLIPLIFIIPIYFSGLNFWAMTSILCLLVALEAFSILFSEFKITSVLGIGGCSIYIIQLVMNLTLYHSKITPVYFHILLLASMSILYKRLPLLKLGSTQTIKKSRIKRPWEYFVFSLSIIILAYDVMTHFSSFFYVFSFFSLVTVSLIGILAEDKKVTATLSFFSFISFFILFAYEMLLMGFLRFATEEIVINLDFFKFLELMVIGILFVSGFLLHRTAISND